MGGHVDQVPGGRHERAQSVGAGFGEVGFAGFHQVDVVVVCSRVAGMLGECPFEQRLRFERPGLGLAAAPVVPGHRVHDRRRVQGGRFGIVGKPLGHFGDRLDPGGVEGRAVGVLVGGVAARECVDQGLLALAGVAPSLLSLSQAVQGLELSLVRHPVVQVAAEGEGLAPVRHRRLRVETRRFLEGPYGLGVVEGVDETQPLVEEALRPVRRGRDRVVEIAQAFELRRERFAGDVVGGCTVGGEDRHGGDGQGREYGSEVRGRHGFSVTVGAAGIVLGRACGAPLVGGSKRQAIGSTIRGQVD